MRWVRAASTGGITAMVAYVVAMIVGSIVMQARGMGDFEGARTMYVGFMIAPAAMLGGFIAGVAFGQRPGHGAGHFLRQLGLALVTITVVIFAGGLVGYATADHPPIIGGRAIELEFEVRIPASSPIPPDLRAANFGASLDATDRDNRFATLQLDAVRSEDGARVVPGAAGLYSHSDHRRLLVGLMGASPSQMFDLKLPAQPTSAQFDWSDWTAPTSLADLTPVPDAEELALRYRVRLAN